MCTVLFELRGHAIIKDEMDIWGSMVNESHWVTQLGTGRFRVQIYRLGNLMEAAS